VLDFHIMAIINDDAAIKTGIWAFRYPFWALAIAFILFFILSKLVGSETTQ